MKKIAPVLFAATVATLGQTAPVKADGNPFVGEIMSTGIGFCPRGWVPAAGQLLAVSSNDALFSLYGTIYGGDGRTTFGMPDLRGRVPIGVGTGAGLTTVRLGQKLGAETVTQTQNTMASHTHGFSGTVSADLQASSTNVDTANPNGAYLGVHPAGQPTYSTDATTLVDMADNSVELTYNLTIGNTGNNQSVNNMAPFLTTFYCVSTIGIYPSRN